MLALAAAFVLVVTGWTIAYAWYYREDWLAVLRFSATFFLLDLLIAVLYVMAWVYLLLHFAR